MTRLALAALAVLLAGCPPRPESVIDAVMLIQEKVRRGERIGNGR